MHEGTRTIPSRLRQALTVRPRLRRALASGIWQIADRLGRLVAGLLVGVWVARYLGPEQFGLFNFAAALLGLFAAVASLGLNNIVVRTLVENPSQTASVAGTALALQLLSGFGCAALSIFLIKVIRPGDVTAHLAVAIMSLALPFRALETIRCHLEARVDGKKIALAEGGAFLITSAIKVALVLSAAPLSSFLWVVPAEAAIAGLLFCVAYRQSGHTPYDWRVDWRAARGLLSESWPLALAGVAAIMYMRIDQLLLGQFASDTEVGIYAAAVRISEVWYFIPTIIAASVFPRLLEARQESAASYRRLLCQLFSALTLLALTMALFVSAFSGSIVSFLYGADYARAATILVIHVWAGVFVFLGIASTRWFIAEGLQKFTLYRTLAGCLVSVVLNILLIPRFGAVGSAFASITAQAVASLLFNACLRRTRPIFRMQINGLTGGLIYPNAR